MEGGRRRVGDGTEASSVDSAVGVVVLSVDLRIVRIETAKDVAKVRCAHTYSFVSASHDGLDGVDDEPTMGMREGDGLAVSAVVSSGVGLPPRLAS